MNKKVKPKIKTSVGLNRTKPLHDKRISRLKKSMKKQADKVVKSEAKDTVRQKPVSKIREAEKLNLWFIPARVSMLLNGIYYLLFSLVAFYGVITSMNLLDPYLILPIDKGYQSLYLLEIAAAFAMLGSLLFFHAAREPKRYVWFYFFVVLFFLPGTFVTNLDKLQLNITPEFQSYLYFDTVITAIFWGVNLLSIYAFFKTLKTSNKQ